MIFSKNLSNALSKYITIIKIVNINKNSYFFVISLTLLTVILDAAGISILLPIGEYILNYETGKLPNTYAWNILKKIFTYIGITLDIVIVVSIAIMLIIARQVVVFAKAMMVDIIRLRAIKTFREKLFVKFLKRDLYYIKEYSTGLYNNIINLEVDNIGKAIVLPLENISSLILLLSYITLMLIISIKATLLVLFFMIITGFLIKNILYYIEKTASKIIKINNRFSQNLIDRLMAIKLIRISNNIEKEESLNKQILGDQYTNNVKLSWIQRIMDSTIEPMLLIIAIPVIVIAIKLNFPLAKLGIFIIVLARFIPIFRTTITSVQSYFTYYASIKNMINLLLVINKQSEKRSGLLKVPKVLDSIQFQNISFSYDNSKQEAVKKFTCEIKGAKINALIGESGSGKSTIINMIPRLIEPDKGKILINNINLKQINVSKIRNACSYIEQKPTFIRGTIIEHISYNKKNISKQKVIEAAKLSNSHNFIMKLKDNYYHKLGESGVGLSGGQLQRLDITRGLASGKLLMILDEPTSNLDLKNTLELLQTLKKINKVKKTTILIVSHDKSVLKYCDNIITI